MLRFIDGFDHYSTDDLRASLKWACSGTPSILATSGRRGTGAASNTGGINHLSKSFDNQSTWIVGHALYFVTSMPLSSTGKGILGFLDATTYQVTIGVNSSGNIVVFRGTTTILATSTNTLSPNTWNFMEVKVRVSNTVGTVEVKVNGTTWINISGVDTCSNTNEYANIVRILSLDYVGGAHRIDDVYIADVQGTMNNDFLGDVRVDLRPITGNGNSSQFTNSDGNSTNNYQFQDDATPDNDTTYVQDSVVGHKDTYPIQALDHTPAAIFGVQPCVVARKDDEGSRSLATVVRSGGTDYPGITQSMSTSYIGYTDIRETDPATGLPWTKSGVDSLEVGVEVAA